MGIAMEDEVLAVPPWLTGQQPTRTISWALLGALGSIYEHS